MNICLVIDVFRASTTACYVLEKKPASYTITNQTAVIRSVVNASSFTIGKSEKGETFSYDIPNSPTRVSERNITDLFVLHRTDAAGQGILRAAEADLILLAGFVNAYATIQLVKCYPNATVMLMPMGHLGATPSLEDTLCANWIKKALDGEEPFSLEPYLKELREGPGSLFFSPDQKQYPESDFHRCLELNQFDFAIEATVQDGYALLYAKKAPMEAD